jgi:tRNA (guanosine-2'-O-)-methyltransferase
MGGGGPKYEAAHGKPLPVDLLLPPRRERIDQVVAHRTRAVTVVLDRLEDSFNMAAVLRTCEGMGLQDVHVVRNPDADFNPNTRVTQGCDKWLDLYVHEDFKTCADHLKARGYRVLASAIQPGAQSLFEIKFDQKIALVLGNERYGVSQDVLDHCDGTFWIPMRGFSQSMNISAAASACVTRAISWRLDHLGAVGDLTAEERAALTEQFGILSVKQRGRLYRTQGGTASPPQPPAGYDARSRKPPKSGA